MANTDAESGHPFLAGVTEGFYGPPWTQAERRELFGLLKTLALNTYLYAPKDDLYHRCLWREAYPAEQMMQLREAVTACHQSGLGFIYAVSPGLSIRYAQDLLSLQKRMEELIAVGCTRFAVLFDDIPDRMEDSDLQRFGSLASAQAFVANSLVCWLRNRGVDSRLLFCPTAYCERMAKSGLGGEGYLATLGSELADEVDVFWTGSDIISREITSANLQGIGALLRRPPVIWDNLYANDYDARRAFVGPYAGRTPELLSKSRGILLNPNCEWELNEVPLRTFAMWVQSRGSNAPRQSYLGALESWLPKLRKATGSTSLKEAVQLFDCFYLPYDDGEEAVRLYQQASALLSRPAAEWARAEVEEFLRNSDRLRSTCAGMADLLRRPLFHALGRKLWELRDELDLLEKYVIHASAGSSGRSDSFISDFHLPGTYRGSFVARLQGLMNQQPDGTTLPSSEDKS